jgi:hypothetical protein
MNIYNQNVAFNYRGILNLDATTINTPLDATLRAVTDGMGTSSPLQLSTSQVGILSVIARASGTNADNPFLLAYTVNNTGGTNTVTGLRINATETAIVGTTHNLMDLQVGGVSKFKVDRLGQLNTNSNAIINGYVQAGQFYGSTFGKLGNFFIDSASDGVVRITDNATTSFNRLQLGGTTNLFPAIKRNGASIDFRLADDSSFCNVTANNFIVPSNGSIGISNGSRAINFDSTGATNLYTAFGGHRFSVFNTSTYIDLITITGNTLTPSVGIGTTTPSARLHVRGDGTNPIARFENNSGGNAWYFTSTGGALNAEVQAKIQGAAISNDYSVVIASYNALGGGALTQGILGVVGTFASAAGSGNKRLANFEYTINNSGVQTGNATGLFLNATETALNGMTHNLMDLQVGGVSKFLVQRTGAIVTSSGNSSFGGGVAIANGADYLGWAGGRLLMYSPSIGMLALNGTTNLFPAIKRNGAAIDFRLADDSGYCDIVTKTINAESVGLMAEFRNTISTALLINNGAASNSITLRVRNTSDGLNRNLYMDTLNLYLQKTSLGSVSIGTDVINASAFFQIDSTTKGFLMPRMTTAQINAIVTPANGLMVYNTDLAQPCFYDGTGWKKVNHSPM